MFFFLYAVIYTSGLGNFVILVADIPHCLCLAGVMLLDFCYPFCSLGVRGGCGLFGILVGVVFVSSALNVSKYWELTHSYGDGPGVRELRESTG